MGGQVKGHTVEWAWLANHVTGKCLIQERPLLSLIPQRSAESRGHKAMCTVLGSCLGAGGGRAVQELTGAAMNLPRVRAEVPSPGPH